MAGRLGWGSGPRIRRYRPGSHLCAFFEEAGIAFIKIGQILSTRGDLLPADCQQELARLQDRAHPEPFDAVRAVVVEELGDDFERLFATFDPVPMGVASIGQVHPATLRDGTDVVVKVQRPWAARQVELDLELLERVTGFLARHSATARRVGLSALGREFSETLRSELDYQREATNCERFAANFGEEAGIKIPRVHRRATTRRVLTLDRLHGLKIDDHVGLRSACIDQRRLSECATRMVLKMVFEDGFFHADPHPGNYVVTPDGAIGLVDFGMVGTIEPSTRLALISLFLGMAGDDIDTVIAALQDLGVGGSIPDRDRLRSDLDHLVVARVVGPLEDIGVGTFLKELLEVARRHRLRLPPSLALLTKTITMHEGLGVSLDPSFRLVKELLPYAQRLVTHAPPTNRVVDARPQAPAVPTPA